MTTAFLAPDPVQSTFFIPGGNTPGNGAQVFFYVAGSVSTKQTAFKDNAATIAWTNPIVLDSGGNLPAGAEVWFTSGQTFKVVWAPSNDTDPPVSPYRTMDNLSGMNDVSVVGSEWMAGPAPTFVSTTSFTLVGDQTGTFKVGRRIKTTNTAGTVYSTITVSVFGVVTTVTIVNDGVGVLDAGLSAVSYGLLDPSLTSIDAYHVNKFGGSIASAANGTTDIWGVPGNYLHITGVNTIGSFSTAAYAGAQRTVTFDGSLSLIHNGTTVSLPGNANIVTQAGDTMVVVASTVSAQLVTQYTRDANGPSAGSILLAVKTANNSTSLTFSSSDVNWSTYQQYEFRFNQIVPTLNTAQLLMRYSADGASTFVSSNSYRYTGVVYNNAAVTVSTVATTFAEIQPIPQRLGSFGPGFNGRMVAETPSALNTKFWMVSDVIFYNQGTNFVFGLTAVDNQTDVNAYNGLTFFMNNGSTASGSISCYGLNKN